MTSNYNIVVAGLGTVGSSFVRNFLGKDRGSVKIVGLCDRGNSLRKDAYNMEGCSYYVDCLEMLRSTRADLLVELIGGSGEVLREIYTEAFNRGMDVVTANKAFLAEDTEWLMGASCDKGCKVLFEAAVLGAIPIVKAVREGLRGSETHSIMGIFNGTSNYIVTDMDMNGKSYEESLGDAQSKGYAEADASYDVQGIDSAHKLKLLSSISFRRELPFTDISIKGIDKLRTSDFIMAGKLGCVIKLISCGISRGEETELWVEPVLLGKETMLSGIGGVLNGAVIDSYPGGELFFAGKGAGGEETSSSVLADVLSLARGGDGASLPSFSEVSSGAVIGRSGSYRHYISLRLGAEDSVIKDKISAYLDKIGIVTTAWEEVSAEDNTQVDISCITEEVGSYFSSAMESYISGFSGIEMNIMAIIGKVS